ncbi:MAG: thioredoxin [Ginsengibacter sp.]
MKRALVLLINICIGSACLSQPDSRKLPVYLRFPTIPAFTIYKAPDSSAFTREKLQKKSTVFMIFDPGCDHCQHETDSIISHIKEFKKVQIVMVTYLPHADMVDFYRDYKISKYPVITMGSDPKFFFPTFFKFYNLPAIFVYDRKRKLTRSFEGTVSINKIKEAL